MIARTIVIAGKVQGVFFREWTVSRAREYGVSGYVRNRPDGSVEIFAQGEAAAVERFVARSTKARPPRWSSTWRSGTLKRSRSTASPAARRSEAYAFAVSARMSGASLGHEMNSECPLPAAVAPDW
jgi:acylphosphatase